MRLLVTIIILLNCAEVHSQSDSICLNQYVLRDLKTLRLIKDSINSDKYGTLKKLGYLPVLYIQSSDSCTYLNKFTNRMDTCIIYSLKMQRVTPGIALKRAKIAVTTISEVDIILVIHDYSSLTSIPYQRWVSVYSYNSSNRLEPISIVSAVFNGNETIQFNPEVGPEPD